MRKPGSLALHAPDVPAMRAIGAALAEVLATLEAPIVIALEGELGAGKTTLVGAILNAFGFAGHARSPTYTLIEPYELGGRAVYHLDLYRLTDPREVDALGLRDLQEPRSILLIEWPERGAGRLPPIDVRITVRYGDSEGRVLGISAASEVGEAVVLACTAATKP